MTEFQNETSMFKIDPVLFSTVKRPFDVRAIVTELSAPADNFNGRSLLYRMIPIGFVVAAELDITNPRSSELFRALLVLWVMISNMPTDEQLSLEESWFYDNYYSLKRWLTMEDRQL